MNKQFMQEHSKPIFRALMIVAIYSEDKLREVSKNSNRCPKCESEITDYTISKPPRISVQSFGDSSSFYTCHGTIIWNVPCHECGDKNFVVTEYDYDIQKGFRVTKSDFFMDERGWFGHSDY